MVVCFENGANQNHPDCLCELGELYENGYKNKMNQWEITRNTELAESYYRRAKEFPRAQHLLGNLLLN